MIDFHLMTRNVLWETMAVPTGPGAPVPAPPTSTLTPAPPAVPEPAPPAEPESSTEKIEETIIKSMFEYLINTNPKPYTKLQGVWGPFISKGYTFPGETEVNTICYNVVNSLTRNTKDSDRFTNLEHYFPLLDLLAQLYDTVFKGKRKGYDLSAANKIVDDFIKKLKNELTANPNLKPIDFKADHPWAVTVKSDFLSLAKDELGKFRLENLDENKSIFQTIVALMNVRQKATSYVLPGPLKNLTAGGIAETVILQPWSVTSGKYQINDQKLKAVYDDLYTNQLVNLSLACYKLYIQQSGQMMGEDAKNVAKDSGLYNWFMGKLEARPASWPTPTTKKESKSFDQTLELLTKELLGETSMYNPRTGLLPKYEPMSPDEPESSAEIVQKKPFETDKPNVFKYDLKNLKEAASTYKLNEAINLYEALKSLANYIKTGGGVFSMKDALKAATGMAKAGMLGTRMAGS